MICILLPCYGLQHTDDIASLFLSFLSSPQSPLFFPPFTPSTPLFYYLKITGVIARLKQISELRLITFLSTGPFRPVFPSPRLHIRWSFPFKGNRLCLDDSPHATVWTSQVRRRTLQFVCQYTCMHKLKKPCWFQRHVHHGWTNHSLFILPWDGFSSQAKQCNSLAHNEAKLFWIDFHCLS